MKNASFRSIGMLLIVISPWVTVQTRADTVTYQQIEWMDLMPEDDLQALLNPPVWLWDIEDGSEEDDISLLTERGLSSEEQRFQDALTSTRVREEYRDQAIRIPGFIVPLAFDDRRRTIEFFLVPYFGACLHLPPPPPNQIIHVRFAEGIDANQLWDPFWIEGVLQIGQVSNELGEAAYRLVADQVMPYTWE